MSPDASMWRLGVTWGANSYAVSGDTSRNVVWGIRCGGADCREQWTIATAIDESVVWGTSIDQSVVWGTWDHDESVVWGTADCGSICAPVISRRR